MKSKIMRIINRRKTPITGPAIAERLDANVNTVRRNCGELVRDGVLVNDGSGYLAPAR